MSSQAPGVELPSFGGEAAAGEAPSGALRPRTVDDVARIVRSARERGIGVTARDQAAGRHGLVLDLSALAAVQEPSEGEALVGAGAGWDAVLARALERGLTPPVLARDLRGSVGCALAIGGLGGASFRYGAQTDSVTELTVVTGRGGVTRCSRALLPELFDLCRAGLGRFGLIVEARIRLVEAPSHARVYDLPYRDLEAFLADQQRVAADGRFDQVVGEVLPSGYALETAKYQGPGRRFDETALLQDLAFTRGAASVGQIPFFEHSVRLAEPRGATEPGPRLGLLLPGSKTGGVLRLLRDMARSELGGGRITTYPLRRSVCRTPLLAMPEEEQLFLVEVVPGIGPGELAPVAAFEVLSDAICREARRIGGRSYPAGSSIGARGIDPAHPWSHDDSLAAAVVSGKRDWDPDGIFAALSGLAVE